jgi:hypothetical protein
MVAMIAYCAADPNYFKLYFDLWATQMNRFYPDMKKIVAVYNPDQSISQRCKDHGVELRLAKLPDNPGRAHYYLLRWLNLPYDTNELILETQINCLAVKTQQFGEQTVDHLRITRPKRDTIGGVSAAVFKSSAAEKIVNQAEKMLAKPYDGDHPMNAWQAKNLVWKKVLAEQQFKQKNVLLEPWCCWITAGTSQYYTAQQKLELLNYYIKESQC